MLNLEDYGKFIAGEEYEVNLHTNKINSFNYINTRTKTFSIDGNFKIQCYMDENDNYVFSITADVKNSDTKEITMDFVSPYIKQADTYIEYIESSVRANNNQLPTKVLTYSNSKKKTEDEFYAKINETISIGPLDKDTKVFTNGISALATIDENPTQQFIFHSDGYFIYNFNGEDSTFQSIDIRSNKDVHISELSKIMASPEYSYGIYNLELLPTKFKCDDNEEIRLDYDDYGIAINSNDDRLVSEIYSFNGRPIFIISLHPLYINMNDTSLRYKENIYCVDQIDFDTNYEYFFYNRMIYEIDDDKLDSLVELLTKINKEGLKPDIATVDLMI